MKIAEDYAMLQHLADGRVDLMVGRGNTGPVYPWFGRDIRQGIPLAIENYALLRREFAALKPAHVPDAPTHASLVAAQGTRDAALHAPADDVTGQAVTV